MVNDRLLRRDLTSLRLKFFVDSNRRHRQFASMAKRPTDSTFGSKVGSEEKPLVVEGRRYLHIAAAARVIGGVSDATLAKWAGKGVTPWGLNLEIYNPQGTRRFIPEDRTRYMHQLLDAYHKARPRDRQHRHMEGFWISEPTYPFGARRGTAERPLDIEGRRYLHITAAAKAMEHVSESTVWKWAAEGVTNWGVNLEIYNHCGLRRYIPEDKVLFIKDQLKAGRTPGSKVHPHPRPTP
jgi:hypothetical protein